MPKDKGNWIVDTIKKLGLGETDLPLICRPPKIALKDAKIQDVSVPGPPRDAIEVLKNPPKLVTVPLSGLVGTEESPSVFSCPTSEIYREPTVDGHAAIVEAIAKPDKEALEWALMCAQEVVDKWPTLTMRTLGSMTETIETLKGALAKVKLDK